jgi:serine/threonine-protein kinase
VVSKRMISIDWVSQQFSELSDITLMPAGGQKWVFGANHPTDGRVVLKLIKPTTNVERVHREVLAVSQVNSGRVPKIFKDGVISDTPLGCDLIWLREQQIQGNNLRQLLTQATPFTPDEILRLGLHVLEALADVERARLVHRDIKPENIMKDTSGCFWLLDFGIARHLDLDSLTATVALGGPGTLGYAPPEQYRNRKRELDCRADLFALAVTLVEVITGAHPYRAGARDAPEVIRRIENTPLAVPHVPWDKNSLLFDLLTSMGQRRIDCRPQNAVDALTWFKEVYAAITT